MAAFSTHGLFSWFELQTTDPAAAAAYYADLFGWTIKEKPIHSGIYREIVVNGMSIGGIMSMAVPDMTAAHWYGYVTVDDVDAVETKARALGATIIAPAFDVPDIGRLMHMMDPDGAYVAFATWAMPT